VLRRQLCCVAEVFIFKIYHHADPNGATQPGARYRAFPLVTFWPPALFPP
jgi:hypothetical protein